MAAPGGGDGGPPAAAAAACAACKYQRRRCAPDCPLAPYFPHDRPRVFRNAHRLFGVSNILKALDRAGPDPDRRHEAMQCIVYESQAWDLYPSAGCVPIIHGLQRRIQQAEHELRRVHADLQAYRRAAEAMSSSSTASPPAPPPPPFMYGGGGEQQMMINNAVTSDDGNIAAVAPPPQTSLPWTIQPPQYEHPFFVNATTMVPQLFHYQQQPIAVSTQLPGLQDDMVNYFADGMDGENDETPRESSTDYSWGEKAVMKNVPNKMKDNNGFMKQEVASSSTLPAAANKS